jgi:hypothetical protein
MRLTSRALRVKVLEHQHAAAFSVMTHLRRAPADATQKWLTHSSVPLLGEAKVNKYGNILDRQENVGRLDVVVR